jgi:hypothetical protein
MRFGDQLGGIVVPKEKTDEPKFSDPYHDAAPADPEVVQDDAGAAPTEAGAMPMPAVPVLKSGGGVPGIPGLDKLGEG